MEQIISSHWQKVNSGTICVADTPEKLWELAVNYFMWSDNNDITISKSVTQGKDAGKSTSQSMPRPYSLKALCLHCGILEEYFRDLRATKEESSLYYIVASRIMYIIYIQNVEYATVGVYNPIFTSKMLGLDKDEPVTQQIKVNIISSIPKLSKSETEALENMK